MDYLNGQFESLVNLEGCKTMLGVSEDGSVFESLVNLEGCKTGNSFDLISRSFESLVNLEGCKTDTECLFRRGRLRVLLI